MDAPSNNVKAAPREQVLIDGRWFELMETGRHNVVVAFETGDLVIVPKSQVEAWRIN